VLTWDPGSDAGVSVTSRLYRKPGCNVRCRLLPAERATVVSKAARIGPNMCLGDISVRSLAARSQGVPPDKPGEFVSVPIRNQLRRPGYPHPMDQIIIAVFIALGAAAVLTAMYLWPPRIG
jgi:hypothetical protein